MLRPSGKPAKIAAKIMKQAAGIKMPAPDKKDQVNIPLITSYNR